MKKPAPKQTDTNEDFLDEIMAERTAQNPDFPKLVEKAKAARKRKS